MTKAVFFFVVAALMTSAHADDRANWRQPEQENLVLFNTSKGKILIEIAEDFAPVHAARIRQLVRSGLYDNTKFHRVIEGFMAQGGNSFTAPSGKASGLPNIAAEFDFRRDPKRQPLASGKLSDEGFIDGFPVATKPEMLAHMTEDRKVDSWIRHCPGVTAMARTNDPDSANSQFFLVTHTSSWLDRKYTAWGRILHGLDVALSLEKGEPPENPDMLLSAIMVADMPTGQRPRVEVLRTDSPSFAEKLNESEVEDICDHAPIEARVSFPRS